MPDIDFQKIVLNLIPKKGDEPVIFYASQYETARPFIADLMWGETEFTPGDDCWAEIDIRKNDDNLVVITDDVAIDNNEVSVILPIQALTCIGKNLGQVKIYAADEQLVAALNFILEVQADPLAGGVTSETAIDNLTQQIEEITQQVIGDDYYNKTEVDDLLDDKADKATTYTKSEVDTALNLKADKATTYTKTQVDSALALKANAADLAVVATTGDYDDLLNKPTIPTKTSDLTNDSGYVTETAIDDLLPIVSASGAIASFNVALEKKLKSITVDNSATIITRCGKNIFNYDISDATNLVKYVQIKTGNGTFTMSTNAPLPEGAAILFFLSGYQTSGGTTAVNGVSNGVPRTVTTTDGYVTFAYRYYGSNPTVYPDGYDTQIEFGSSATSYEPYNGTDYPVADIDDITTLNGVNNIFADVGDVSVQVYDSIQHYIDSRT